MRSLLLIPLGLLLGACPHPIPPGSGPKTDKVDPRLAQALALPPVEATGPALTALKTAADAGSCAAAWARGRYLLDLYDTARLQPLMTAPHGKQYAKARQVLWSGLDLAGAAGRGRLATLQVQNRLEALFKAIPETCAGNKEARLALDLLQADRGKRDTVKAALTVVTAYKRVARRGSTLGPNATIRLINWCDVAFRMAAGGEISLQHEMINQCLFPLFDANPSPYFEDNPDRRPPDPPWTLLVDRQLRLIKKLSSGRLAPLGQTLERSCKAFIEDARPRLPLPLSLKMIKIPRSEAGPAWDRTPLVLYTGGGYLIGGQAILEGQEDDLREAIARRIRGDRRGIVTLVVNPGSAARVALTVGRAARLAGARTLALGVTREVAASTVPGDVQELIFGKGPVLRLHGVPLSLLPLSPKRVLTTSRDRPHGLEYDPRTASGQLALFLTRGRVSISSKDGLMQPVKFEDLRASLAQVQKAYPDDSSLLLIPRPDAIIEELILAASISGSATDGRPLFTGLALGPAGTAPPSDQDLAPRLRLLGPARVELTPAVSRALPRTLLRCYHTALAATLGEASAVPPEGTLQASSRRKKVRISGGTIKDKALRRCTATALEGRIPAGTSVLTVTFSKGTGR